MKEKHINYLFKNKKQICKNIKTIRHYLELNQTEFAEKTGIGKRAIELETGRFRPTQEEIDKIEILSGVQGRWIIHFDLCLQICRNSNI